MKNVLGFLVSFIWCYWTSQKPSIPEESSKKLILAWRSVLGQLNLCMTLWAATMAPLTLITIVRSTSPFWTSLFTMLMIGDYISWVEIIAMVICFSAVIVTGMLARSAEVEDGEDR